VSNAIASSICRSAALNHYPLTGLDLGPHTPGRRAKSGHLLGRHAATLEAKPYHRLRN
jgi:hypothetical protein